ncbi:MAG: DapH/DapD/GlmU-related protein [Candidatus Aminicenantes bacterium]|jgi:acetyltransferase-like isoleucine patch superfamily enzyme
MRRPAILKFFNQFIAWAWVFRYNLCMNKNKDHFKSGYIHPTAVVETGKIGDGTDINPFCYIMPSAAIGKNCNICAFVTIDEGVVIEDNVTIMNGAYVAEGTHVKRGVFIGPNVVITNDRYPRSPRVSRFSKKYAPENRWLVETEIGAYASIGANATVICGNHIGEYALVGAGALVTKPVPPFALVLGNPARFIAWINEDCERVEQRPW